MPFSGFFYSDIDVLTPYHFLGAGLAEFIIFLSIALSERIRGIISIALFMAPFTALPSLFQAGEQLYISIYFIVMMSMCAFVYRSQINNMAYIVKDNIIDNSLIVMVFIAVIGKIYVAFTVNIQDQVPFILSFIMAREGAIAGSNFISQLIFTLLPLSRNTIVRSISIGLLLFTFSRGAYLCLSIYLVWNLIFNKNRVKIIKILCVLGVMLITTLSLFKSNIIDSTISFASERIVSHETTDLETRYKNEDRFKIFSDALEISKNSNFMGVGLGGFYYAQKEFVGADSEYSVSNAHNLYLTILAEGGILPFLLLILCLITVFVRSWRISGTGAPLSVLLLSVYFLFSGSFYESSRYITLAPYCLFVFLLAYIEFMRKISWQR